MAQHHRRSIRLKGYDYTQAGAYFVTIVTEGRRAWFGSIVQGEMQLNPVGQMIAREWERLPSRFSGLEIDAFVIMPDHVHGILMLCSSVAAQDDFHRSTNVDPGSVGAIVRAFKSSTTLRFHRMRDGGSGSLWQRNYYERIVRGPKALENIRAYIFTNPTRDH